MIDRDDKRERSTARASGAADDRATEGSSGSLGPMGRDRVQDSRGYYDKLADRGPGEPPQPAPMTGAGGSMGGGPGASGDRMMGEPAQGARGHIAGDSQGGRIEDGSAPDTEQPPNV